MAISEADKIRRAEEIYYRRRYNKDYRSVNNEPQRKNRGFIPWFIGKVVYISLIVCCVYAYNNKEYLLSDQFKKDFESFINQPVNMNQIMEIFDNQNYNQMVEKNETNEKKENNESANEIVENSITYVNEISTEIIKATYLKNYTDNSNNNIKNNKTININNKEKKLTTAQIIKSKCKFKFPIKGTVTSRFGNRTSTYKNVSKNHTGIDISAKYGTYIRSAIEGKVIEVSSVGNYGKHLKIQSKSDPNIVTLYAHCSKILVKKGDNIKIGDKIARVGNTGNVTGTHLHFEIRYKNKCINPDSILEF